jgi:glycosyltransferase involved in cell wall biosynthesis
MPQVAKNRTIAFVVPYPFNIAPGQRFRYEQYLQALKDNGFEYTLYPFYDEHTNSILYREGLLFKKTIGIIRSYLRRFGDLFRIRNADYVFLYREAAPLGPPVFEFVMARVMKKKIIYDFDDAIWLPNVSDSNRFFSFMKWYRKVGYICSISWKISCGNKYLADYARRFNNNVVLNPTTIDTTHHHNKLKTFSDGPLVIGWTGTHSTIKYLHDLLPVFEKLAKTHQFKLLVISDRKPDFDEPFLEYIPWNKKSEIDDLLKIDVGLMPLTDDQWTRGKCGFKALQYMSLGIPAIASPVGVNTMVVDDGVNGYICDTHEEWYDCLRLLASDKQQLLKLAAHTRDKIERGYSVKSNTANFLSLFD